MLIANENEIPARTFPAGRISRNLVGGRSPVSAELFNLGKVVLDATGGQVPWHNHPQEEIYYIVLGHGEMCVGEDIAQVQAGDVIYVPPGVYHQLTNTSNGELEFLYCYAPAGDVAHWHEELEGTLAVAGVDAPPLPVGASPQFQPVSG